MRRFRTLLIPYGFHTRYVGTHTRRELAETALACEQETNLADEEDEFIPPLLHSTRRITQYVWTIPTRPLEALHGD